MRVLIVSNFYPPRAVGGAEIVAHRHALELSRRGHEVAVFAGRIPKSDQTGGELTLEKVDGLDVHLLSIRSLEPGRAFYWDAAGRRFRSVLHHFRPDVVHFHNLSGLGVNLILEAKRFGAQTVCTVHDHWGFCARNTLLQLSLAVCDDFDGCHFCVNQLHDEAGKALPVRLRRDYIMTCLSKVDKLVFPSRYLRDIYINAGFDPANMQYISNGIEVDRFKAKPDADAAKPLRITVIGYLGVHKGFDVLREALDLLSSNPPANEQWKLSIVGDGHMRPQVRQMADDPAYGGHVEYLGKLASDEIPALLADTGVLLLPSIWPENEPVVMLEAIASGVAQLASDTGGHPELVVEGESGLLFKRASATDLAAKLRLYIENPELARQHGQFNWRRRKSLLQAAAVDAYERLYLAPAVAARGTGPVIICDGDWPSLKIAQMINNLSLVESAHTVRLVYAGWANPLLWSEASAVFVWSGFQEGLLLRASRLGLPIVAPASSSEIRFLLREGRPGFGFRDAAEALGALVALANGKWPIQAESDDDVARDDLADFIAATISPEAFRLSNEMPSI